MSLGFLVAGCAMDEDEPTEDGDSVGGEADVGGNGKADAAFDSIVKELTDKYGVRPHKYNGFFDGTNEAEKRFLAALPKVTADMNARATALHLPIAFTQAELATNFITEGGYYLLDADFHDSGQMVTVAGQTGMFAIDAFSFLGADTIVDNAAAVQPWLSDDLKRLVADPAHQFEATNELGKTVHSIYVDTIEQGLALNAAMFAWSRQLAAHAAGTAYGKWSAHAKFFWTTVWYNAGPGTGATQLAAQGVDWSEKKWTLGDDPKYARYVRYNALWRSATWELMSRTVQFP